MTQHVHLIGICGTGMGSLAGLFHAAGWRVTGSDQKVYPPMSTMLERLQIPVYEGFSADHVASRPDLVVIGNVCTKDNPEARAAIDGGLTYRSLPDALAEHFCAGRRTLVVAGTHGKTTTSSLASWLLQAAGRSPGFLIGGIPRNFGVSFQLGDTDTEFVIEGDEYDTAFFDKTPKLWHYPASAALLGPVEFDHADIYADLAAVTHAFREFVRRMPASAVLAACADSANVTEIAQAAQCRVLTYGVHEQTAAYAKPQRVQMGPDGTQFTLTCHGEPIAFHSPLTGWHNLQNTVGVLTVLTALGIPADALAHGLREFAGIKRRQEVVGTPRDITIIDDFAHHPTAIAETLTGLRYRYPHQRLLVGYEPRSNTSGRRIFHDAYLDAFAKADRVYLGTVHKVDRIAPELRLDPTQLAADLTARGVQTVHIPTTDGIRDALLAEAKSGDVIVLMSNGDFGHIHGKLLAALEA